MNELSWICVISLSTKYSVWDWIKERCRRTNKTKQKQKATKILQKKFYFLKFYLISFHKILQLKHTCSCDQLRTSSNASTASAQSWIESHALVRTSQNRSCCGECSHWSTSHANNSNRLFNEICTVREREREMKIITKDHENIFEQK